MKSQPYRIFPNPLHASPNFHSPSLSSLHSPKQNSHVRGNIEELNKNQGNWMKNVRKGRTGEAEDAKSKLFPSYLVFLLGNEEKNVDHFRNLIANQKKRVEKDFSSLSQSIIHIIQDLKLSVQAQLDLLFRQFLSQYANLKIQISQMRENRKKIIKSYKSQDYFPTSNKQNKNTSNSDYLTEISQDEEYFCNHQIYEHITKAHQERMERILQTGQNLIEMGSQGEFYRKQKGSKVMEKIREEVQTIKKRIFEKELDNMVVRSGQIIQKQKQNINNVYYVDERSEDHSHKINEDYSYKINDDYSHKRSHSKNISINIDEQQFVKKKKKRPLSISHNQSTCHQNYFQYPKNSISKNHQDFVKNANSLQKLVPTSHITCREAKSILICCLFVNHGRYLIVGCKDSHIYVYQVSSGKFIVKLSAHTASICTLTDFGDFFASGGDNGCGCLALWNSSQFTLQNKVKLHHAAITCIVDLGDGLHLATGGYDNRILVYNFCQGEIGFEVSSNKSSITSMVVCCSSNKLVSAGLDMSVTIWNICLRNGRVDDIRLQNIVNNFGLISVMRPINFSSEWILLGNNEGKVFMMNVHSGKSSKNVKVGKGAILALSVIQQRTKTQLPTILTFCAYNQELILTKMENDENIICQNAYIVHGCGIGPMIAGHRDLIGVVSQLEQDKTVRMYKVEGF